MDKAIRVQSIVGTAAMVWILKVDESGEKWIQVAIVTGMAKAHTFDRAISEQILATIDKVIEGTCAPETLTIDDFSMSTGNNLFSIRRNLYRGINDSFVIERESLLNMIEEREKYLIVTSVY